MNIKVDGRSLNVRKTLPEEGKEVQVQHGHFYLTKFAKQLFHHNHFLNYITTYFLAVTCPDTWHQHGSYCYKYFDDYKTFSDAATSCASEGGKITSIDSAETNKFINKDIGKKILKEIN